MNGALLGAAATALTVKTALSGPLGAAAEEPLNQAKAKLNDAVQPVASRLSVPAGLQATSGRRTVPTPNPPKPAPGPRLQANDSANGPKNGRPLSPAAIRKIVHDAALRHGLDPRLLLAISYWESGWDQSRVSSAGAVGILQVEPDTANEAGPALLGRQVDLTDPYDNADVGAAVFRQYLDAFGNPALALAAYNQGPTSLQANGMFPDTQQYVAGILDLASRMTPEGTLIR